MKPVWFQQKNDAMVFFDIMSLTVFSIWDFGPRYQIGLYWGPKGPTLYFFVVFFKFYLTHTHYLQ